MKALVIRDFIMGSSKYQKGQEVSMWPDEKVNRLVGEGLVVKLEDQTISDQPEPEVEQPEATEEKKSKRRKK